MKVVLTGGGTGGHVYPLLAIAEQIGDGEFLYIGTKRGAEARMVKGMRFEPISAAPFPRSFKNPVGLAIFLFKLIPGVYKAWKILGKFRPDILISSGGYVSVPGVIAAKIRGIPILLHEQNVIPGRANLLLSKLAWAVAVSFPDTKKYFSGRVFYTGYPLRKMVRRISRDKAREQLSIPKDATMIFVFGGSRGARIINQSFARSSNLLIDKGWWILHSSGIGYPDYNAFQDTRNILEEKGTWGSPSYILKEYVEEMDVAYSAADLVVCRAGAGTIEELKRVKKPALLIPKMGLPGEHQLHNALFLKRAGVAEVLMENPDGIPPSVLMEALDKALSRTGDMEKAYEKFQEIRPEIDFKTLVERALGKKEGFGSRVFSSALGVSISRFFGFVREIFIGGVFGTSLATDIFAVSLTIASFFRRVVGENAMDNAFLPSFLKAKRKGEGKKLAISVLALFLFVSSLLVLLLEITLPHWFHYIAPGFVKKGVVSQGIALTRMMLPYLVLVTLIGWTGAVLKANNKFAQAEGSSSFYSIGIIVAVILLARKYSFYSLGVGVLLGGFLQAGYLLLNLKNRYFGEEKGRKGPLIHPWVITVGLLTLPILLDVSFSKLSDFVDKILATPLQNGAVAALYFAAILFRLPVNIIGNSINNVVLRDFSHRFHGENRASSLEVIYRGFKYHFVFLLPATFFTWAFATPIVSVVYQRGAFGFRSLEMTSSALSFYSLSIIAWGLSAMAGKLFAARLETHISMWTNASAISLNVILSILLVRSMGFQGLALATSISLYFAALLRFFILDRRMRKEGFKIVWIRVGKEALRWGAGTIFSVGSGYLFYKLFVGINLGSRFVSLFFALALSFTVALVFLVVFYFITKNNGRVRRHEAASKVSLPSKEEIGAMLLSSDWERVNRAVKIIGKLKLDEFREKLEELVLKGNGFIRRNAVLSLAELSPSQSTFEVLKRACRDPYYEVRAAVAFCLSRYPGSEEVLKVLLEDKWFEVKERAIISLSKIGGREVLDYIRKFYSDINYRLRLASAEALLVLRERGVITKEEARQQARNIIMVSEGFEPKFLIREKIAKLMEE